MIPKAARDRLGLSAGTELELRVVDERLEIAVPSRVRVEDGPHGLRFTAGEVDERLTSATVRDLMEGVRR